MEENLIKLYKKWDICRDEWILEREFYKVKDKYVAVEYKTPQNSKYSKRGYGIRYVKKEDVYNAHASLHR